jgi:iron complex outermembrane receptor protein
LVTFESYGQFADVKTGEFQILSNEESWGSDWMEWILGAYYIDSSAGYDPLFFTAAPNVVSYLASPPASGPLAGLSTATQPLFDALTNELGAGAMLDFTKNGLNLNLEGILDTKSTAYFFQTTVQLNDWIGLTLGGRYQEESRKLVKSTTRYMPDKNSPDDVIPVFDFGQREAQTYNFSPKVALDFKIFDDDMFYMSFSEGFKSGTYNIIAIFTPTQYIEPEKTTSFELGVKSTMLDGALQLNAAVFENEIENLQVQTISLTSGGAVRFETAGSAQIQGAEFDFMWQIFPEALPGLVATMAASYLNGKYTSYEKGSGFDQDTGIFFDGSTFPARDFTGNETVRTPQWSGNAGLNYNFVLGDGNFELATDVYYNGGFYYSSQNTEAAREDEYYVVNSRISYLYYPLNTRLTAYGKNLNNGEYHYVVQDLDFGTAKLLAPRASYGLKLSWDWEF